jgi:hypothetical protein
MLNRRDIARAAADAIAGASDPAPALVGFDGFIDSITHLVRRRFDMTPGGYERITTIPEFARRCENAAGTSTNIERVTLENRFGGNGPLMAGALGALGTPTTFIGAVGVRAGGADHWRIHPLFETFASRCLRCIPIGEPSHTLCLEFDDGKVMMNDTASVQAVTWDRIIGVIGLSDLRRAVKESSLLAVVNWSLLAGVEGILSGLQRECLNDGEERSLFIDISDPAKRLDEDIRRMLALLRDLECTPGLSVTLGLNLAEARRIADVAGLPSLASQGEALGEGVSELRRSIGLSCVVVHPREGAASATADGAWWFDGPFTPAPRLSTGAGDHFNAGFAFARSLGLDMPLCLAAACAASGLYVREGASPTRERLVSFLRDLP